MAGGLLYVCALFLLVSDLALRVALVFGCGCDWCEADAGGDVVPVPMMAVPPMLLYN